MRIKKKVECSADPDDLTKILTPIDYKRYFYVIYPINFVGYWDGITSTTAVLFYRYGDKIYHFKDI